MTAEAKKQRTVLKRDPTRVHFVPLSKQALAILEELRPLTGMGRHVFPAAYMPERRELMQWWADYLDDLKKGAEVIPIRKIV